MELGLNHMRLGNFVEARKWMDECKTYSSYALEAIVHFRIHTALRQMSLVNKQQKLQQKNQQLDCLNEHADGNEEEMTEDIDVEEMKKDTDSSGSSGLSSIWSALSRRLSGKNSSSSSSTSSGIDSSTCAEEVREEEKKEKVVVGKSVSVGETLQQKP